MKKILVLIAILVSLSVTFSNKANAASDAFSTAWKLSTTYAGYGAGHGTWRMNDTTFFNATIAGNLYKLVFSGSSIVSALTTNTWGVGTALGTGSSLGPRGITVTPDGYVVVADNLNNRLYSWDQNFNPLTMGVYNTPAGTNGRVYGISSDSVGHIFINYYIFQYSNLTSIGHKRVEIFAHPNTWTGATLTPLQSFDVDTAAGGGYIWEGSVAKQDASAVYIATRAVNKVYKYSGSIGSGYNPDPVFTTFHPHNVPDLSAYGLRNIALTADESRLIATYNALSTQPTGDTTGVYIVDAVYGDILPTSSILTNGNNYLSPSRAQTLANDSEMIVVSVFDSPVMRLQRAMNLSPRTFNGSPAIWANETTVQFSSVGGDGSASYSIQVIAGSATLSPTGLFTPTGRGRAIVVVQDTSGDLDSSNSIPIKQVTMSPSGPLVLNPSAGVTLSAGGDGVAPYTWQVSNGTLGAISNASANQALFTAGASYGTATVFATDTNGHKGTVIINVTPTSAPLMQDVTSVIPSAHKDIIRFDLFE